MALPARDVILVLCTEDRVCGALPGLAGSSPWWPEAWDAVAAARQTYGIDVTVLRLLTASVPRMPGGVVTYLAELHGDVDVVRGLPLQHWPGDPLGEHPYRQSWARPGGPRAHVRWAIDRLREAGLELTGAAEQRKTWNLSTLWRLPTDHGEAWLKVVPDFFAHEGAIIAAIDRPAVPQLYGYGSGRLVMADHPGDNFETHGVALAPMVTLLTDLQSAWVGRTDELLRLGLPDHRLAGLRPRIEHLVADRLPGFAMNDRDVLIGLIADLDRRSRMITECGVPETLTHGDFHPGNVQGTPDHYVIMDWGDSCVSHPLTDELAFTRRLAPADRALAGRWFSSAWRRLVPGCEPERAAALLRPVLPLTAAVAYADFCAQIEDDEQIYHAADVDDMLRQAVAEVQR